MPILRAKKKIMRCLKEGAAAIPAPGKVRVCGVFTEEERKRCQTITKTINPVLENT